MLKAQGMGSEVLPSACCFTVGTHTEKSLVAAARALPLWYPFSLTHYFGLSIHSEIRLGSHKHPGRKHGDSHPQGTGLTRLDTACFIDALRSGSHLRS